MTRLPPFRRPGLRSSKGSWRPGVEAAVTAVAEAIEASLPARNTNFGLAGGQAGIALFFEYLDRVRPGAGYGEIAQRRLEQAIEDISTSLRPPTCSGASPASPGWPSISREEWQQDGEDGRGRS